MTQIRTLIGISVLIVLLPGMSLWAGGAEEGTTSAGDASMPAASGGTYSEARMVAAGDRSTDRKVIMGHLLPGFLSYLVVSITLAIPHMILGETTLSFLGLGILPPEVSWGSMMQQARSLIVIFNYPWHLIPTIFIVTAVLAFNFIGDGLRDAADPYSR